MNHRNSFTPVSFFRKKILFLFQAAVLCVLTCTSTTALSNPDEPSEGRKNLPVLSVSEGIMSFVGDVGYTGLNQPLLARSGFQVEVQKHTNTRFSFSIFLLSGKVFGNEQSLSRNLNFQTGIVSEGVQLRYDFISKTNSKQVLIPFISAGVEYMVFHPKADLKDADGNTYYYWKDGSIRNMAQSDSNASHAVLLHRDYSYETELTDANIDGFGKFKETTIAFPIGAGVRFKLSGRCSMHFSSVCHFTNTDLIDAVTSESIGARQGNSKNDRFIYSSVSFRYDFSGPRETPRKARVVKPLIDVTNVDFAALEKEDADSDKVPDIYDSEALNPTDVKVDANGKPLDTDGDGIPDYRDDELNSAKNALVNEHGVTITEEMIEEEFRRDSLAALPAILEYVKSVDRLTASDSTPVAIKKFDKRDLLSNVNNIPKLYRKLDADFNGVISPQEISDAIDDYLAGKSPYSSEQFYRLIDFFFKQH